MKQTNAILASLTIEHFNFGGSKKQKSVYLGLIMLKFLPMDKCFRCLFLAISGKITLRSVSKSAKLKKISILQLAIKISQLLQDLKQSNTNSVHLYTSKK